MPSIETLTEAPINTEALANMDIDNNCDMESDKSSIVSDLFIEDGTDDLEAGEDIEARDKEILEDELLQTDGEKSPHNQELNSAEEDAYLIDTVDAAETDSTALNGYCETQDGEFISQYEREKEPSDEDKAQAEDDEDLLNVSMVREKDEDDACAMAEVIDEEVEQKEDEEELKDEEPESESNEETAMDVEESKDEEPPKENESAKIEQTVDEIIQNLEDVTVGNKMEIDNKQLDVVEKTPVEIEETTEVENEETTEIENEETTEAENEENTKEVEKHEEPEPTATEDEVVVVSKPTAPKRLFSASDNDSTESKKARIDGLSKVMDGPKMHALVTFEKYMRTRKMFDRLSRSDLEQFCVQKICECLVLKSTDGELFQTVRKLKESNETLRKDRLQLQKQCKDLETVKRKLLNELSNNRPAVPMKITRSVGLQVRLTAPNEVVNNNNNNNNNRPTRAKSIPGTPTQVKTIPLHINRSIPMQTVVGQATTPQKTQLATNHTSPMLSQALKNRTNATKRTTPVKKTLEPAKSTSTNGVIDLTDEDDKSKNKGIVTRPIGKGKSLVGSKSIALSTGNKTVPTSLRLASGPVLTTTNGNQHLLYMLPTLAGGNNSNSKVLFNFHPSNGVISPVSVVQGKPGQQLGFKTVQSFKQKHPAPLPTPPRNITDAKFKPLPPKPHLTIKKVDTGIILQWKMPYDLDQYETIASYQLYAYQETSQSPHSDMWRKVGDVKALALPMACTLSQFAEKNKYYFAVRSVDVNKRIGPFSDPEEISL